MRLSLGRKIVIMFILFAVILSGFCIAVSGLVNRRTMEKEYMITADALAATVAVVVDGDKIERVTDKVMEVYDSSELRIDNSRSDEPQFEEYSAQFFDIMSDEDYKELSQQLRELERVCEADCVYTVCVDPDCKTAVYIVDGANIDPITPGCFDMIEEDCYDYLDDLTQGLPAFITNTPEYGWVVTACAPIYNSSGEVVCFAAVDLSMNEVLEKERNFLYALAGMLVLITVIVSIIAIYYVNRKIVRPINMLSQAAGQYGKKQIGSNEHKEFSSIDIHTGDELEILLDSMIKMEADIDKYFDNLTRTREQLTSAMQQADNMHELAHMDALTGLRNKLAYDKEINVLDESLKDGKQEFGIAMVDLNFLKIINDSFGHDCGNEAIKLLSSTICDIFVHSPVFRIGGDEFAIVLRNSDYENIESLMKKFNERLDVLGKDEEREPWERISAAFGYAIFDSNIDLCADDVFRRADKSMYERKKAMKAERK